MDDVRAREMAESLAAELARRGVTVILLGQGPGRRRRAVASEPACPQAVPFQPRSREQGGCPMSENTQLAGPGPAAMGTPHRRRPAAAAGGRSRPGLVCLRPAGQARPDPGRRGEQRQDPDRPPADGRRTSLTASLTDPKPGTTKLDWTLTGTKDATSGLKSGVYYAVLTIPSDFSSAIVSSGTDKPVRGQVQLVSNSAASTTMSYISEEVVAAATTSLGNQTTQGYLKNVYDGFNQIAKSNKSAASTQRRSRDGTAQVSEGAAQLDDGTSELADSLGQVASGIRKPAGGYGLRRQWSSRGPAGRGRRLEGGPKAAHRCGEPRRQLPHPGQGQRGPGGQGEEGGQRAEPVSRPAPRGLPAPPVG